jgi:hypothetical protein
MSAEFNPGNAQPKGLLHQYISAINPQSVRALSAARFSGCLACLLSTPPPAVETMRKPYALTSIDFGPELTASAETCCQ